MRWALLLALVSTSALASRADRLSVSPRLDRRDRLGASSAVSPILLALSLLPPDSECSGTTPVGVTFSRSSVATCIDSTGKAFALAANQARVTSKGLLVEGATTNALLRTRATSTPPWTCPTCGAATLGMDELTSVPRIAVGTASQGITPATGARIASVYVRNVAGLGCSVSLSADATTTGPVAVSNFGDWSRVVLPYTSDADVTIALAVSGTGCSVAADYWQDEAGSIATSPVVSAGTSATRAGEVAYVPRGAQSVSEGCAAIDMTPAGWSGNRNTYVVVGESLPGATNLLYSTTGAVIASVGAAGSGPAALAGSHSSGVTQRFRSAYSASDSSIVVCAGASCSSPAAFATFADFGARLSIGARNTSADHVLGHLSNLVLGNAPGACQ